MTVILAAVSAWTPGRDRLTVGRSLLASLMPPALKPFAMACHLVVCYRQDHSRHTACLLCSPRHAHVTQTKDQCNCVQNLNVLSLRDMLSMLGSTACAVCIGYMAGLGNSIRAAGIGRGVPALAMHLVPVAANSWKPSALTPAPHRNGLRRNLHQQNMSTDTAQAHFCSDRFWFTWVHTGQNGYHNVTVDGRI